MTDMRDELNRMRENANELQSLVQILDEKLDEPGPVVIDDETAENLRDRARDVIDQWRAAKFMVERFSSISFNGDITNLLIHIQKHSTKAWSRYFDRGSEVRELEDRIEELEGDDA